MIDAASKIASIGAHQIGTNLATFYDPTTPSLPAQVASVAPNILRWPGGSLADGYHWQNNTDCNGNRSEAYYIKGSTFDNFMNDIVLPGGYDAAITVAYGSNPSCSGGGDPNEAAAWVAHVKANGWNSKIHYWTVGNEEYGGWELDLHSAAHDPNTYVAAMNGSGGYYQLMKAQDQTAQIGVVVVGDGTDNGWDEPVLSKAQYDYVELHWYAQQPGQENDSWLLNSGPAKLTSVIANLRQELKNAGKSATTPIMLGEVNSVAYGQGKQTISIVNGLFTGMALGELLQDGVDVTTWWFGAGGNQGCGNNNSGSLYGFQNFGGYDLVASNTQYNYNGCNTGTVVPEGTVFPAGNAFAMVQDFAQGGNSMLAVSVDSSLSGVKAYAATRDGGYALMLFNLNQSQSVTTTVGVKNASASSFNASTVTYGKEQYDQSQSNKWPGPVNGTLGTMNGSASVTLPPWSMTVVKLQ